MLVLGTTGQAWGSAIWMKNGEVPKHTSNTLNPFYQNKWCKWNPIPKNGVLLRYRLCTRWELHRPANLCLPYNDAFFQIRYTSIQNPVLLALLWYHRLCRKLFDLFWSHFANNISLAVVFSMIMMMMMMMMMMIMMMMMMMITHKGNNNTDRLI